MRVHRFSPTVWMAIVVVLTTSAVGCTSDDGASPDYEQTVMQDRVQRDMQMREKESVVPPGRKDAFRGLDYYPVDPAYRYVVRLRRQPNPDTVRIPESTGAATTQVRVGHVEVPLPEGPTRLEVFRGTGDDPRGRFWLPFADPTNEDSTYKAGRYVDLQRRGKGDSVVVDFNRAYNPTCTYNPNYACPLPPAENRLGQPVPAGEKRPHFAGAS